MDLINETAYKDISIFILFYLFLIKKILIIIYIFDLLEFDNDTNVLEKALLLSIR